MTPAPDDFPPLMFRSRHPLTAASLKAIKRQYEAFIKVGGVFVLGPEIEIYQLLDGEWVQIESFVWSPTEAERPDGDHA